MSLFAKLGTALQNIKFKNRDRKIANLEKTAFNRLSWLMEHEKKEILKEKGSVYPTYTSNKETPKVVTQQSMDRNFIDAISSIGSNLAKNAVPPKESLNILNKLFYDSEMERKRKLFGDMYSTQQAKPTILEKKSNDDVIIEKIEASPEKEQVNQRELFEQNEIRLEEEKKRKEQLDQLIKEKEELKQKLIEEQRAVEQKQLELEKEKERILSLERERLQRELEEKLQLEKKKMEEEREKLKQELEKQKLWEQQKSLEEQHLQEAKELKLKLEEEKKMMEQKRSEEEQRLSKEKKDLEEKQKQLENERKRLLENLQNQNQNQNTKKQKVSSTAEKDSKSSKSSKSSKTSKTLKEKEKTSIKTIEPTIEPLLPTATITTPTSEPTPPWIANDKEKVTETVTKLTEEDHIKMESHYKKLNVAKHGTEVLDNISLSLDLIRGVGPQVLAKLKEQNISDIQQLVDLPDHKLTDLRKFIPRILIIRNRAAEILEIKNKNEAK